MQSQLLSALVQVILAVVLPALALIIRAAAQRAVAALEQQAEARIADSDRAALYAAVKIGLRVAEKNGTTVDGVWQKALGSGVDMAQEYLTRLGISDLSASYLRELIEVESHKQENAPVEGAVDELRLKQLMREAAEEAALAQRNKDTPRQSLVRALIEASRLARESGYETKSVERRIPREVQPDKPEPTS